MCPPNTEASALPTHGSWLTLAQTRQLAHSSPNTEAHERPLPNGRAAGRLDLHDSDVWGSSLDLQQMAESIARRGRLEWLGVT